MSATFRVRVIRGALEKSNLTENEIDAVICAVNAFDEARAALETIDRLAGCQSSSYQDLSLALGECRSIAQAVLAKMERG